MRHTRRAFTLVEILVVIGIILILIGLLVTGFRHVSRAAAVRETQAELKVCTGMLTEYSKNNGLKNIEWGITSPATAQTSDTTAAAPALFPVFYWFVAPPGTPGATSYQGSYIQTFGPGFYTYTLGQPMTGGVGTYWPCLKAPTAVPAPSGTDDFSITGGSVTTTDLGATTSGYPRYASKAVNYTRDVFYILLRVPANRTIFQSLQSKRILEADPSLTTPTIDQGAVILDGWGNPIIYVPRGGMHTLIMNQTTNVYDMYLVRSTSITDLGPASGSPPDPAMTGAERPFFASAGEDGDFTLGADNVYSFQQ